MNIFNKVLRNDLSNKRPSIQPSQLYTPKLFTSTSSNSYILDGNENTNLNPPLSLLLKFMLPWNNYYKWGIEE